jgi:hypothetical protein
MVKYAKQTPESWKSRWAVFRQQGHGWINPI